VIKQAILINGRQILNANKWMGGEGKAKQVPEHFNRIAQIPEIHRRLIL
jgi:hypothetical protein